MIGIRPLRKYELRRLQLMSAISPKIVGDLDHCRIDSGKIFRTEMLSDNAERLNKLSQLDSNEVKSNLCDKVKVSKVLIYVKRIYNKYDV